MYHISIKRQIIRLSNDINNIRIGKKNKVCSIIKIYELIGKIASFHLVYNMSKSQ